MTQLSENMEELYEAILEMDIDEIKKIIKLIPDKSSILRTRIDGHLFQDEGLFQKTTSKEGLNPLMFALWSNGPYPDWSDEISPDLLPLCKLLLQLSNDPHSTVYENVTGGKTKHTIFTLAEKILNYAQKEKSDEEIQRIQSVIDYFKSPIILRAAAAAATKKSKKKKKSKTKKKSKMKVYYFYMDHCKFCTQFNPVWEKLKKHPDLKHVSFYKKKNTSKKLIQKYMGSMQIYPSIVKVQGKHFELYPNDNRKLSKLVSFIKN